MMNMILIYIKRAFRALFSFLFRLTPIKKQLIVFDNFNGRGFGCNPKYIALRLLDKNPNLDLVWLASDKNEKFPDGVKCVHYNSIEAWWVLSKASVRVSNVRSSKGVKKRRGQLCIQTWHASLGPKMIEKDAQKTLAKSYIKEAHLNGLETDLMFSNNEFMSHIYQNSFWYKGPVLRCGVPRNRPLLDHERDYASIIKSQYGIPLSNSICLYAPTWRSNDSFSIDSIPFRSWLSSLEDRFNTKFTILLRLHPNSDFRVKIDDSSIVDVSSFPDFQELVAASDVLISDYSSSLEDWVLTERPGFMFTPDYDEYLLDRQFYYPLNQRPYPIARSSSELCDLIRSYDEGSQIDLIRSFKRQFDIKDDGMGDSIIANVIIDYVESGKLDLDCYECSE